jgi:hypothetical protein
MKKLCALFLLSFYAGFIFAQTINLNQGKIEQKRYFQEIPYQKIKGVPVVSVTINGETYKFVFDTGASFLHISDDLYRRLNLSVLGQRKIADSSGEIKVMKKILLTELHLQKITFSNIHGYVLSDEDFRLFKCLGIDGIIGSNMLENSVVHFDEKNSKIIITHNIRKLSIDNSTYQKMKRSLIRPIITIVLGEKRESVTNVMFDSGQNDFFMMYIGEYDSLNKSFVKKISESEGSLGFGIHGTHANQKHLLLIISKFNVNNIIFKDIIATTQHGSDSRIGAKLLEYGKVTLDYKKKRFYFEPYNNINTDELSKAPWAIEFTMQNDKKVVGIIWDKTLESKINLGDEILSINGVDLQSMDRCELFQLKVVPENDKIIILKLKDINTGEIKEVEIKRIPFVK